MAFDAGELVATLRMGAMQAFVSDANTAKKAFLGIGSAADTAGAKSTGSSKQQAAAAKAAATASQQAAAAAEKAGQRTAAAAQQQATAQKQTATAARTAGAAAQQAGAQSEAAAKRPIDPLKQQQAEQKAAAKAAKDAAAAEEKAARDAEAALRKQNDALHEVGTAVTAFGVAASAAFGLAVKTSADFSASQAQLRALAKGDTDSAAQLQAQMQQASDAALTAGKAYGQTAQQVSEAEIELQKAGIGIQAQLGGALPGALTLAAAGQVDVAEATSTAATAMTQFELSAKDVPHLADLLAAGSDKALGSVDDLSMGLKQGGLVASQMGLSIDDTVGTLSAFAQAGLIGSDAGTSFKTMLLALQSPSQQAQAYLDKYNITAYDSQGAFVGITNLAGQLQEKLGGLTQAQRDAALSTIFGSDAIRSANVLYTNGASGIQGWIDKVNDSGFASRQAADKMDSLSGDATKLSAAFQNGLIKAGVALEPVLRLIVQGATAGADAFSSLDPTVAGVGLALVGIVGAAALAGGALLLMLPKIRAIQLASRELAASDVPLLSAGLRKGSVAMGGFRSAASSAASFLGGPWGLALAAGGLALSAFQKAQDDAKASTEELDAAVRQTGDGAQLLKVGFGGANILQTLGIGPDSQDIVDHFKASVHDLAAIKFGGELSKGAGVSGAILDTTRDTLKQVGAALAQVSSQDAPTAARSFETLAKMTDGSKRSLRTLLDTMPEYESALRASAIAAGVNVTEGSKAEQQTKLLAYAQQLATSSGNEAADASADAASEMGQIAGSADGATSSVKDLANALKGLGSTQLDANAAQRDFEQAVDDATKAISKASGGVNKLRTGFDLTKQAGRDGQEALDGIASSAAANAAALESNGASQKDITQAVKDGRAEYIKAATAMGIAKTAAEKLADGVHLVPGDVELIFRAQNAATVQQRIDDIKASMNNLQGTTADIYINARLAGVDPSRASQIAKNALQDNPTRAGGGDLDMAPGPKGQDSQLFWGAKGEHVLSADDVDAMGGQGKVYAFRRGLHSGVPGYATGGAIGDAESKRNAAQRQADALQRQIDKQVAAVKKARVAAKKAEQAYQKASDASSAIYGKGTGDEKHGAAQRARELSKKSKAADAKEKAAEKKLSDLRDQLGKKQDTVEKQQDRRTSLGQDREDLAFDITQGNLVDPSNVYGAFNEALSASRNSNYTKAQRKTLDQVAHVQGDALARLSKESDAAKAAIDADNESLSKAQDAASKASSELDNVTSAMNSMRDSVASTVTGFFDLGSVLKDTESITTSISHNAGTLAQWDEKVTTVTQGGTTVGDIRAQSLAAANTENGFASQLERLVSRGYSTLVVQDVARLGVDKGSQIASALLNGSGDDVAAINANYASAASAGQRAGNAVAGQAYGDQLSAANAAVSAAQQQVDLAQKQLAADQAHADAITASITASQQAIVNALQTALSGSRKANGGIVERFAAGGIRPQAHIAPAGSNRILYGEPETGGEAYIPLSPSKRTRSLAILGETARRLGATVLSRQTRAMADGGILGGGAGDGGDFYDLRGAQFVNTSKQDVVDALRQMQDERKGSVMSTTLRRPRGA